MKQLDPKAVWLFFFQSCFGCCLPFAFLAFYFGLSGSFLAVFAGLFKMSSQQNSTVNFDYSASTSTVWVILGPLLFFILYLVACFVWAKLTVHFYRYELVDAGFRKESGIITKKYVTIPYDRIQNVDIHRSLFARMFGLSSLMIQTAGASAVYGARGGAMGMSAEGFLPGISKEVAEQLRDELISRAGQTKNKGL